MSPPIKFADLLNAYEWVSAAPSGENSAYISRFTGTVHLASKEMELNEELPEDYEDASV